ncbi:MAG: anti-sigma factor antagonist [Actinomycetota bacterium]|nr:anti-sigma factor antagonist [Actinomycetota bacterium]
MSTIETLTGTVRVDRGVVVIPVGEVDLATVPAFRALVDEALSVGTGTVTVNLAGVGFMDARGLSVLVAAARELRGSGRQLVIRGPSPQIRRLFEITDLTEYLGVEPLPAVSALNRALVLAATAPISRELLDAALRLVVAMAHVVVEGADGASITLPRQGRLGTVAASNDVVLQMDTDQYETGEGPCMDAATQGERFHICSLDTEERWPAFVPRARARGIRSIMSTPLMAEGAPLGALNIYSRTVDAFAEHEQEWADRFAAEAAAVITHARTSPTARDLDRQLQEGLESREVIALAQGITMGRVGGTANEAYLVLRDVSVRTGQPLLEVCAQVVAAKSHHARGGDHEPVAP